MNERIEFHRDKLKRCCLVCGEFLKGHGYTSKRLKDDINNCFSIDIQDASEWQPYKLCKCCVSKTLKWKKNKEYRHSTQVMSWLPHSEESCSVCEFYYKRCKGGAKRKSTKGRGRPCKKLSQPREIINATFQIPKNLATSLFPRTAMPPLDRILSPNELTVCPICKEVMEAPVLGPCEHAYCSTCLQTWAEHCQQNGQEVTCPECKSELHVMTIHPPPRPLLQLINDTKAKCRRCNNIYALDAMELHELTCTRTRVPLQPVIHSPEKVPDLLTRSLDVPLSHTEQRLTSRLIQRKINTEGDKLISLVTQGRVCTKFYCLIDFFGKSWSIHLLG